MSMFTELFEAREGAFTGPEQAVFVRFVHGLEDMAFVHQVLECLRQRMGETDFGTVRGYMPDRGSARVTVKLAGRDADAIWLHVRDSVMPLITGRSPEVTLRYGPEGPQTPEKTMTL
ncbi:MAG TPA: hypothetical protein VFR34_05255 [Paracoccaceae bacterium]|nr:hypothetical protein [Paracoccaceae bacterium]